MERIMLKLFIPTASPATQFPPATANCEGSRLTRGVARSAMGLLVASLFVISGCEGRQANGGTATAPQPTASPTPVPMDGTATPDPLPPQAAPDTTIAANASQLPATLVRDWEPLSNVLFEFGGMTIEPGQITWDSGQTSQYSLVGTEGGYLLRLEPVPVFFDIANPYIKLIPKTAEPGGAVTEVEVAFFEDEQKARSDEYVMFGTYFVQ
jgi:hypothetical protein